MAYTCFDLEITDHVAHLRLNRPEAYNSMIAEFWSELPAAVTEINEQAKARAIVISSTGKHFCSGMDPAARAGEDASGLGLGRKQARMRSTVKSLQWTATALEACRVPVPMAMQGGVIGG